MSLQSGLKKGKNMANAKNKVKPRQSLSEYHSDETLKQIASWPEDDFMGLIYFLKPLWAYHGFKYYWYKDKMVKRWLLRFELSTSGWSGNEDIFRALESNFYFGFIWYSEWRRGGFHAFDIDPVNCGYKMVSKLVKDLKVTRQYIYRYPHNFKFIKVSPNTVYAKQIVIKRTHNQSDI